MNTPPQRPPLERCRWCAAPLQPIQVHGHIQCARCGINVDPCCGGEQACPPPGTFGARPGPSSADA